MHATMDLEHINKPENFMWIWLMESGIILLINCMCRNQEEKSWRNKIFLSKKKKKGSWRNKFLVYSIDSSYIYIKEV